MFKTEDRYFLKRLLSKSLSSSKKKIEVEEIVVEVERFFEREDEYHYEDVVVYSAVELALYRKGYAKEAKKFNKTWEEYRNVLPKQFSKERN